MNWEMFSNIKGLPDSNNNYPIWNVMRVADKVYREILVLPLEEANELLASSNDQFELIVIKVVVIKVIGHQFFDVLGKKESGSYPGASLDGTGHYKR
jgi:hypothetical protein